VNRNSIVIILGLTVSLLGAGCSPQREAAINSDEVVNTTMDEIRPEAMRAHIRFLADDLLEGRGTGTRGYQVAANYVAAHFEALGLEPAGVDGTYFQPVPLRKVDLEPGRSSMSVSRNGQVHTLTYAEDYLLDAWKANNLQDAETSVTAPVVFAGHGVTAPELDYDDYANVDARGKIVALFEFAAPSSFPDDQRAYYASDSVKAQNAADHGAVGMLTFMRPQEAERWPWDWCVPQFENGSLCWLDDRGSPQSLSGVIPEIQARVLLNRSGAEALFVDAPHTLEDVFATADEGDPFSFDLPVEVSVETVTRHRAMDCANVAAMLPGSDPVLRNEYVVFTAHLDHLGVGEPVDGDAIYNGAYDNASGVAALMEVARALTVLPKPPPRSVVFVAVTGEESGLVGADYFAHDPTVPAEQIIANINIDEVAIWYDLLDVVAYGSEHSTIVRAVKNAASRLAVEISPDPMPEECFFIRSDQYAFVCQGIPAVWVAAGTETGDPELDGAAIMSDWLQTRYHTPKDDLDQPIDFNAAAKHARLYFLIGHEVANNLERPAWNPGDFFGEKSGR
jgi:hypothetical protein